MTFFTFKPHRKFFFCIIKWKHIKRFLGGSFQPVASPLNDMCQQKCTPRNGVYPSLGSMTEGPTDTSEILILMSRPGQKPSIYICLSVVKMVDFMHPKWEECIVTNSLIFVVVSRNIFALPKFGKELSMNKASIK